MKANISKLITWVIIISVVGGCILLINYKVFQNQYSAPQTVKEQLSFPLSKVTVYMDKKAMHDAFDNCSWLNATRGFKLTPSGDNEAKYLLIVNKNDQANRLATIYNEEGFKWDAESKTFTLASDSKGVWVPTWILYELISDGCFSGVR